MIYPNDSIDAILALECQRTENYLNIPRDIAASCENCGDNLYEGDDYLEHDGYIYCRKCIMSMTSEDVVELLGFKFRQACRKDV